MNLTRIETPGIAHYAYLLSDGVEAALIDPRRDIEDYLATARQQGVHIKYVIETHRQEDFVMGSAYLAEVTGATIVNGDHELFGHGDLRLKDEETFSLGSLTLQCLHTPGHTPESCCYAVYSDQNSEQAWAVFTGDTLFFGTTGRTDLTDPDHSIQNAGHLFDSVHTKLAPLGDTALVLPAHGPGSVCGSGMANRSHSTLGEEKRYNPVFTLKRDDFARKKGGERPAQPPFFKHMEAVNLNGGIKPVHRSGSVPLLDVATFSENRSNQLVFDTREPEGFAGGHIKNSYSIWLGGLPVFGGWIGDRHSPICLVGDRQSDIDTAALHLSRIGIDNIQGGLAGGFSTWRSSGEPIQTSGTITPEELHSRLQHYQVLDVREIDEFESGHIPNAHHHYVGHLKDQIDSLELEPSQPLVVTCGVGHRAGLGVSILLKAGFTEVYNLLGGMKAWHQLGLTTD